MTGASVDAGNAGAPSTWAPLRVPIFRMLWAAQFGANLGTWMQMVGAQWLLVGQPNAATLVALVQTAISLPMVLLALPAGVLADVFDRRRLLLGAQASQVIVAATLAGVTLTGRMTPGLLLALTFLLGCGAAVVIPAWQSIQPDLVPREQIPSAAALTGVNVNLARAVGPALAGALVAAAGAGWVFALNAMSFLIAGAAVAAWRAPAKPADFVPERLLPALSAGGRYVRHSLVVRRVLLRTALFIVPGSALWALLPVVASSRLGLDASGYGLLLGALGTGAVGGAFLLPRLRARLSTSALLGGCTVLFAGATLVLGLVRVPAVAVAVLLPAGVAWLAVFSTLMAAMQVTLPAWVRARGSASWLLVFMLGQALGAVGWGVLAELVSLPFALTVAAGMLAAGGLTVRAWPMIGDAHLDHTPSLHWATPQLVFEPDPQEGPVLVTLVYRVPLTNATAFTAAMQRVGRSRRRTGAARWRMYRDGADLSRFVELYIVPSWSEHLRQHHGRITAADRTFEEEALELTDGSPVQVSHLFPSDLVVPPPADPADPKLRRWP